MRSRPRTIHSSVMTEPEYVAYAWQAGIRVVQSSKESHFPWLLAIDWHLSGAEPGGRG